MGAIDPIKLEAELRKMQPRQKMYELIKAELERRGHWKRIAGGKQMQRGYDPRRYGL